MFYPNEQVIVKFHIDNSRSTRDIKAINCTLNYEIKIKKNANESMMNFGSDL